MSARPIIRTWPLRGPLHFVAAEDVRWRLALLIRRVSAFRVLTTRKATRRKTKVLVTLAPFEPLSPVPMEAAAAAAEPYDRFLGLPVEINR